MARCIVTAAIFAVLVRIAVWPADFAGGAQDTVVHIEPRIKGSAFPSNRRPDIRSDANLVLIPVLVTDGRDRLVLGLQREDFRLYDDQVEQRITHFVNEDAPVSMAIVFDASSSMGPKLKKSREAVTEILRTANPGDEFALIQIKDHAELLEPLTDRPEQIQNRLLFMESKGQTALLDAIYLAINTMKNARHQRRAIVIISDGGDNCSRYTVQEVKSRVREADVQMFVVAIIEPPHLRGHTHEEINGPDLLDGLAKETGGRMFMTETENELSGIAVQISRALRNQYLIGYTPANVERDGKYHRVLVRLAGIAGLRLSWRTGYYAPLM